MLDLTYQNPVSRTYQAPLQIESDGRYSSSSTILGPVQAKSRKN